MTLQYDEALKVIEKSAHDFTLERVYCLYLKQMVYIISITKIQYTEAYNLLKQKSDSSENAKLLEAQILYRMERYEESLKLYQGLSKSVRYDKSLSLLGRI